MKKWTTTLSLALVLGLASVATAELTERDSEIRAKVEQSLEKKDLGAVQADVANGVVTLEGKSQEYLGQKRSHQTNARVSKASLGGRGQARDSFR